MKILILNYEFPPLGGGASPVSYELAKGYVEAGHKVAVVTMGYKDLKAVTIEDGISVFRIPCWRSKKEICHTWEQLSYLYHARNFLKNHLKEYEYDVCHTHFIIPTGLLALWVKNEFGIPYVITPHGSDVPGYNTDRFKFLHLFTGPMLRKVVEGASKIISPSNYLLNLIKKNIKPDLGDKGIVIPNGIDANEFVPKEKQKIIFSSGRLLPRKGFQYLLQAVHDEDLGYEVHICGDGPMMEELKKLAATSKTKVVLHGWVSNKSDLYRNLLETAAVYSLVSLKENASIALLEAMSAGCAVITSNIAGCPETVGESGIAIEAANVTALQTTLHSLLADNEKLKTMGEQARQRILERYQWTVLVKNYEQELEQLLVSTALV